jgi:gluconolactonase
MTEFRVVTTGLRFPEGPIALPNGDVLVVEVAGGALTRVAPDGTKTVVANTGGGPNGAAIGPDGACYICNNGGIKVIQAGDLLLPDETPEDQAPGWIQRVDLTTGEVKTLYAHSEKTPFWGPNDLVFDNDGGFWFSDFGRLHDRYQHRGSLYYAKADGSYIEEVVHPMEMANGVGLSPDGKSLYVAETFTSQVWRFELDGPGRIKRGAHGNGGTVIGRAGPNQFLDSLAVDSANNVCVASPGGGGIMVFAGDGSGQYHVPMPDFMTTNICFGGPDLRTAYITLASTGQLVAMPWPHAGAKLNYLNR